MERCSLGHGTAVFLATMDRPLSTLQLLTDWQITLSTTSRVAPMEKCGSGHGAVAFLAEFIPPKARDEVLSLWRNKFLRNEGMGTCLRAIRMQASQSLRSGSDLRISPLRTD